MLTHAPTPTRSLRGGHDIVVIAASTTDTAALSKILRRLPRGFPAAILVVLDGAPGQDAAHDNMLCSKCRLPVRAAEDGETIRAGHVYVVPADHHVRVTAHHRLALFDRSRPSYVGSPADPAFDSAAVVFGASAVGVVLSGHGSNGIQGAKRLHDAGGFVIAQDEATSEQFDMPRAVIEAGVVHRVLPIEQIPTALFLLTRRMYAGEAWPFAMAETRHGDIW